MALYETIFGLGATVAPTPGNLITGTEATPKATPYDTIFSTSATSPAPAPAAPDAAATAEAARLERVQLAQQRRADTLVAREDRLVDEKAKPTGEIPTVSLYNNHGFSGSVGAGLVTSSSWVD